MQAFDLYEPTESVLLEQMIALYLTRHEPVLASETLELLRRKFPLTNAKLRAERLFP